jgi:hypothetical protein
MMPLDRDALRRWVEDSCATQGVQVGVSDALVVAQLGVLLGGSGGGGKPAVAGDPGARLSEAPGGDDSFGQKDVGGPPGIGHDRGVVEDRGDDSGLPGKVQRLPALPKLRAVTD